MLMNYFNAMSYREIIANEISRNASIRGYKKKLSEAGGFHAAYLSQILSETANLTADQASLLCEFWDYDERMSEYFIALVNLEKATSESLKARIIKRLSVLRSLRSQPETVIKSELNLSTKHSQILFSSPDYFAVLAALALPQIRNKEALSNFLKLHEDHLQMILNQLLEMEFIAKDGDYWRPADENQMLIEHSRTLTYNLVGALHAKFCQAYIHDYQSMCYAAVVPVRMDMYNQVKEELRGILQKLTEAHGGNGEFVAGVNLSLFRY